MTHTQIVPKFERRDGSSNQRSAAKQREMNERYHTPSIIIVLFDSHFVEHVVGERQIAHGSTTGEMTDGCLKPTGKRALITSSRRDLRIKSEKVDETKGTYLGGGKREVFEHLFVIGRISIHFHSAQLQESRHIALSRSLHHAAC
jgi:hypothetical protein